MVNPEHVGMPSYLFVGIIANTFWLHRTVTDMRAEETTSANAIMSLCLSISSLVWVCPHTPTHERTPHSTPAGPLYF